jgi:hypothetical protein
LNALRAEYNAGSGGDSGVDFLAVYIAEAHTSDCWPMPVGGCVNTIAKPTTLEQRLALARAHMEQTGFDWPVVVDGMNDDFLEVFAAWPERFFIVESEWNAAAVDPHSHAATAFTFTLTFIGQPTEVGHCINDIRSALRRMSPTSSAAAEGRTMAGHAHWSTQQKDLLRALSCMLLSYTDADVVTPQQYMSFDQDTAASDTAHFQRHLCIDVGEIQRLQEAHPPCAPGVVPFLGDIMASIGLSSTGLVTFHQVMQAFDKLSLEEQTTFLCQLRQDADRPEILSSSVAIVA